MGSEPLCRWCGAPLIDDDGRAGWHVARCAACGAGSTLPAPSAQELDAAYPTAYRPAAGRFGGAGDRLLTLTRGTLARRIDRLAPAGPVLDVGSGDGSLLAALRRRGREATGLERGADGPGVLDAAVADLPGGWAAIVLWHSLEHLEDPAGTLRDAAERLAPGGHLLVAVPNLDSVQARVSGERWLALDLPRHLVHLPAATLVAHLRALGLNVGRVSHWRGGQVLFGALHGLVARLPGRPDLYDAIRRPEARLQGQSEPRRHLALVAGVALSPVALGLAALEIATRRGGTVYVEARRP